MKHFLLFSTLMFSFFVAVAQPLVFPIKDGEIYFEDVVTVKQITADTILQRIKDFAIDKEAKYHLKEKANPENTTVIDYDGLMRIDPEKGDYRAVDCSFKLRLTVVNDRYKYEIYNFYFIKEDQRFDVNEVYKGYIKNSPLVKQALEEKKMAVGRHEFYLKILNYKIKDMLSSLKKQVTTG